MAWKTSRPIKVFAAGEGVGMTLAEAKRFMSKSRSVIKLGTIDASGDPNIHPVWYYFGPEGLFAFVGSYTKKLRNIRKRQRIYFLVDDDRWAPKGVRGKGEAEVLDRADGMAIVEKILVRYIKKSHELYAGYVDNTRKGNYVIVKIEPRYFSTWDYGKMPRSLLSAGLK